jgi:hypothetical protein
MKEFEIHYKGFDNELGNLKIKFGFPIKNEIESIKE